MASLDFMERVFSFNREVVKIGDRPLATLTGDEKTWLWKALNEEAVELDISTTIADQVDALCDSIVFACGGFARMGLTPKQAMDCLQTVMDANAEKKAGQKTGRSYAGVADAIKPEGWVGPEDRIAKILNPPPPGRFDNLISVAEESDLDAQG